MRIIEELFGGIAKAVAVVASKAYPSVHPGPAVPRPATIKDHLTKLKSQIDEEVRN